MYHVSDVNLSFGTLPNGRLYADVAFQVHFHPEVTLSNLPFGLYMSIYSQPQDGFNGFSGFNGGFSGNFQGQRPQGLVWAGRESISANGFPTLQFNRRVMLNQFQGPWFNFNTFMQQFAHTFFTQIWLVPEHVEQQGWNQVSSFSRAFTPWMQQPWQMGLQEFAYNQFGFGNQGNWGYNQGFGNGFQREYFAPAQQNMFAHFGHPAGFGYGSFGNGFGYGYNGFGNGFGYGYGQQALNNYGGYGSYGSYPGYPSSYHTNYGYHQSSPISQQYGQRWGNGFGYGNGFGNSYGNNWNWNNGWNNSFGSQFPVQTGYQNAFAPTYYNGFQGVGNFNSGINGGFGNSGGTQTHRTETVTYNTAQPSTHPGARPALAVSQVQY